jgi:molecular chaperone DnaJ
VIFISKLGLSPIPLAVHLFILHSQLGTTFRLRGKGIKTLGENHHGDLYVHVTIAVPTKLSAEQKAHLEAFALSFGETPSSTMEEGFFEKAKKFFK